MGNEEDATALYDRIQTEGCTADKFRDLATEYSKCESGKDQGGSIGQYGRKDGLMREFEDVVWTCPIGQVQSPVKWSEGWSLLLVSARKTLGETKAGAKPLEHFEERESSSSSDTC